MIKVSEKFTFSEKHRGLTAPEKFSCETFFLELLTWPIWKSWETSVGREGRTPGSKWWQRRQDPPENILLPRWHTKEKEWTVWMKKSIIKASPGRYSDRAPESQCLGWQTLLPKNRWLFPLITIKETTQILNYFTISKGFWIVRQMKVDKQRKKEATMPLQPSWCSAEGRRGRRGWRRRSSRWWGWSRWWWRTPRQRSRWGQRTTGRERGKPCWRKMMKRPCQANACTGL